MGVLEEIGRAAGQNIDQSPVLQPEWYTRNEVGWGRPPIAHGNCPQVLSQIGFVQF